jgi:FMN phosphatase YigB (HAD superfamily)
MTIVFDLDHTLCEIWKNENGNWDYMGAVPYLDRIKTVNELYNMGHMIIIDSARGSVSGKNWLKETQQQVRSWGLKYHKLRVGVKIPADIYVDDKGVNANEYFR